jgi:hypothetical protein
LPPPRFDLLTHHFASCMLSFKTDSCVRVVEIVRDTTQAVAISVGFHLTWSKALPLARTAQAVRANLLANAATTTL